MGFLIGILHLLHFLSLSVFSTWIDTFGNFLLTREAMYTGTTVTGITRRRNWEMERDVEEAGGDGLRE